MDKAFLKLKSKGIQLDDKLCRQTDGSSNGDFETGKKNKILEQVKQYKAISNTFKLLHNNQLQLNAETARPMTDYVKSRQSASKHTSLFSNQKKRTSLKLEM